MSEATDVLQAIDQLRRDLSGYHGQLKAHDDLRRHCDNQRERIVQLERLHAEAKAENAKLRELVRGLKYCAHEAYGMCARVPVGGERPFTCCPLYDFDAKKYRCEELMLELEIEVPS